MNHPQISPDFEAGVAPLAFSVVDTLSLVIGALELALALVVLRHLGRFGRAFPWLALLMAFFALRGVDRLFVGFVGDEPAALSLVSDTVLVAVLILLIVGIERMVRGLRLTQDEAAFREREYERALTDYRRLARHRLANPLAAIRGGVTTLREVRGLDADARDEMLAIIDAEARRLEQIALDPDSTSEEERELRPKPELEPRLRS